MAGNKKTDSNSWPTQPSFLRKVAAVRRPAQQEGRSDSCMPPGCVVSCYRQMYLASVIPTYADTIAACPPRHCLSRSAGAMPCSALSCRKPAVSDDQLIAPIPEHAHMPAKHLKVFDLLLDLVVCDSHDAPEGATGPPVLSPHQQEPHGRGRTRRWEEHCIQTLPCESPPRLRPLVSQRTGRWRQETAASLSPARLARPVASSRGLSPTHTPGCSGFLWGSRRLSASLASAACREMGLRPL